jgi:hypothetical protein
MKTMTSSSVRPQVAKLRAMRFPEMYSPNLSASDRDHIQFARYMMRAFLKRPSR